MPSSPWTLIMVRPVLKCQYLGALELGNSSACKRCPKKTFTFAGRHPWPAVAPLSLTTRTLKVVLQDEYGTQGLRHHCLKVRRRKIDPGTTKNCVPEQLQLGTDSLPSLPSGFFSALQKYAVLSLILKRLQARIHPCVLAFQLNFHIIFINFYF